jgi:hypothetical protein
VPRARGWRAPDAVLLGTLVLVVGAAAAVVGSAPGDEQSLSAGELRGLLGGVGLGRAVDMSRCASAFDGRLFGRCDLRYSPLPGVDALCPDHSLPPPGNR